jgi:hypothetical protein
VVDEHLELSSSQHLESRSEEDQSKEAETGMQQMMENDQSEMLEFSSNEDPIEARLREIDERTDRTSKSIPVQRFGLK